MTPLYAGIGGVVRELTEVNAGINGVVTPLTEMWAGVNGVNRQIFSSEKPISEYPEGSIVGIKENGILVPFYVAKHNYESSLNGTGRTLLLRKDCHSEQVWDEGNVNAYASSDIDAWFNGTYKNMLDTKVLSEIGTTKIKYTPGNGNNTVGTLSRSVFALSATEYGERYFTNTEGSKLPISSLIKKGYIDGVAVSQWSRSPQTDATFTAFSMSVSGNASGANCYLSRGARPAFTLPHDFLI